MSMNVDSLQDEPSQCAKLGKPLFVSAEIVECDLGPDYWCSSSADRPLVATIGVKGQSLSSIEVEDYRYITLFENCSIRSSIPHHLALHER